jgi:hypothetical protein
MNIEDYLIGIMSGLMMGLILGGWLVFGFFSTVMSY